MDYAAHYDPPLGSITMANDGEALWGLRFDGQKYYADVLGRGTRNGNSLSLSRRGTGRTHTSPGATPASCHRVMGTDGSLTGYAGGVWRNERLRELEGVDLTGLYAPKWGT